MKAVEKGQAMKFAKPKIMLVDLPQEAGESLRELGFNVAVGTFGSRYSVVKRYDPVGVRLSADLPGLNEQEIVFIDLQQPPLDSVPPGPPLADGVQGYHAPSNEGWADPRPLGMSSVRERVDRIIMTGGIVVVFAEALYNYKYKIGQSIGGSFFGDKEQHISNWSFMKIGQPAYLRVIDDSGSEVRSQNSGIGAVDKFTRHYASDAFFRAAIMPNTGLQAQEPSAVTCPIMMSKFGDPVSLFVKFEGNAGAVFVLPQFRNKAAVAVELVQSVFPEVCPALFADFGGGKWVHLPEYEHISVYEMRKQQEAIVEEAKAKIEALETEIASEAAKWAFLHGMLTNTGEQLVQDIKHALEHLGFSDVRNVDEELPEGSTAKQEDLQIHDERPTLIVEVKGIGGLPNEADVSQVVKYVHRRAKQWNRLDLQGLVIVNHQRNLPPLSRSNDRVFTAQQIADAEHQEYGIVTTWDLFRLVRGTIKWGWPKDSVREVLFRRGRIEPVPAHLQRVGQIAHFYDKLGVASIQLDLTEAIRVGETLAFFVGEEFVTEGVVSLTSDRQQISEAAPGTKVGHKTAHRRQDLPEGRIVYRLRAQPHSKNGL
jgi:hypothetical protein